MSGFKRMQSKVFWGHMASHDLDNTPLLYSSIRDIPSNIYQNSYCNYGRDSESDNDKNSRETNDIPTINVLRSEDDKKNIDKDDSVDNAVLNIGIPCEKHEETDEDIKKYPNNLMTLSKHQNYVAVIPRPFSPFDQGHGSLDSGFSDSERPKSPKSSNTDDIDNNTSTRRRRKRRRRSRDTRDIIGLNIHHSRLNSSWIANELPSSNPSHTSTPKRDIHELSGLHNFQCNDNNSEHTRILHNNIHKNSSVLEEQVEVSYERPPEFIHVSKNDECLDEFLYANEPPEDDDIPTTSSSSISQDSTPRFIGPWYSRISTGSSSKSTSRSIDKNQRIIFEKKIYSSVKMWLKDLTRDVEDDYCVMLQSKALPKRKPLCEMNEGEQTRDLKMMTAMATSAATELLVHADNFTKHIQEVISKISHLENVRSERELLRSIEEEAFSILSELGAPPPRRIHDGSLQSLLNQLNALNNMVSCTLNTRLDFYIERVVRGLEDAPRESGSVARGALAALTALGLAGVRAGDSIARCAGVRALLTSLISAGRLSSELRASTLRALASVCCSPLAINHFVKEGGPEILMDLLISKSTPESEKMEATALIVQITAPWIDALGLTHLEPFAKILINVLTCLAEETKCGQTLLLCAAALNNLSDSKSCSHAIVHCDSVRRLLRCVKKLPNANIWLMEQVASLINKLAKNSQMRIYLAKARASVALVSFLRMAPPGLEDAYQRLSTTAATALTRLCVDEEIARQVVAVGGADCLPKGLLCDYDYDNNDGRSGLLKYSKSLRVACERAAKRINDAKACDFSV